MVFEGQVAKNTVIYSVFLTNVKKHWYLRCFHSHRNIKQRNLRGFWKFWSASSMQKTEKHCKNQCFCYHKTTKISPKTGPKTQKSASGPGHLRNRKKRCCKPKNWGQKVEKHRVFSLFACRFWTGAFTNRCLPYCFLQCFLKASVTTYQKQEVLAEKWDPPQVNL